MGTYGGWFGPHNPDETYIPHDFPEHFHASMHGQDPQLFTETLVDWVSKQPASR